MKYWLFIVSMLFFIGCGKGKDPEPVPPPPPPDEVPVYTLEGFYFLPEDGYIELVELYDGRVMIYGTQRVYSRNTGGTTDLAFHPTMSGGPHILRNNAIIGSYNVTYVEATHNIRKDGSNSHIDELQLTSYKLYLNGEGRLVIELVIYEDTHPFEIDVQRTIISE